MVQEPRRINVANEDDNVGGQSSARFGPSTEVRRQVNYHNIWWTIGLEPENADANAQGFWILWIKKDATASDPAFTTANLNAETFNQRIIALGQWSATNQSPFNMSSHLNSSRNLLPGEELVITVRSEGITAGQVSVMLTLQAGETGK